jgi:catechol 2,3-dioxygenase-like lactoylglutathione lyase family enzyme
MSATTGKARVTSFAPQFLIDDIERSIAYYQKIGFSFDEPWDGFYAIGHLDGLEVHLKEAPRNQAERQWRRDNEHLDASAGVDGIEAFYEVCVAAGVMVIKPLTATAWGTKNFYVEDPDGYIISFGGKPAADQAAAAPDRNLASINPFFIVKDLQASISHYAGRLGFQLDFQGPAGDPYYARVSRDGIGIMLKAILPDVLPRPNRTRHEWARWDAYIYALDPDALFDEFRQRGVSFVTGLSFIDEGLWGFEVTDADGYVLAFAEVRDQ